MELTEIYFQLKKYKLAERAAEEAVELNNKFAIRWAKLAQVQEKRGEREQAMSSINRALEIEPHNQNYQQIRDQIAGGG